MPYLTQDIIGSASRITYGRKGDQVKIYSDHDNVVIVERPDGLRFSINKTILSKQKVDADVPIEIPKKGLKKK